MQHSDPAPRIRFAWGRRGAADAARRGDLLVVVDTLSFSTATATAVQQGAAVHPCGWDEDPAEVAPGAEVAVSRKEVPALGRFSLSPPTLEAAGPGEVVVLRSPNGATCSLFGGVVPRLYCAAPVNAATVAAAVARDLETGVARAVTVLACGERWPDTGRLRVALEDELGAGAVLARLPGPRTAEAEACTRTFEACRERFAELIRECESGIELREAGFPGDVRHAARLDVYDTVPLLSDGAFRAAS